MKIITTIIILIIGAIPIVKEIIKLIKKGDE